MNLDDHAARLLGRARQNPNPDTAARDARFVRMLAALPWRGAQQDVRTAWVRLALEKAGYEGEVSARRWALAKYASNAALFARAFTPPRTQRMGRTALELAYAVALSPTPWRLTPTPPGFPEADAVPWLRAADKVLRPWWESRAYESEPLLHFAGRVLSRTNAVGLAAALARPSLRFIPRGEDRPLRAIDAAERWVRGTMSRAEVAETVRLVEIYRREAAAAENDLAAQAAFTARAPALAAAYTPDDRFWVGGGSLSAEASIEGVVVFTLVDAAREFSGERESGKCARIRALQPFPSLVESFGRPTDGA